MKTPNLFRYGRTIVSYSISLFAPTIIVLLIVKNFDNEVISLAVGVYLATFKDVTGYLYGTSKDKSDAEQAQVYKDSQDVNKP